MDAQKTSTWTNLVRILTKKDKTVNDNTKVKSVKSSPADDIDWEAVPAQ